MELLLDTPTTARHYEQWATIMERVTGDVFSTEELAHVFATDRESAWLLALRGDVPVGCGVGRPSSLAGSLYAMVRVLPEHRLKGIGSTLYEQAALSPALGAWPNPVRAGGSSRARLPGPECGPHRGRACRTAAWRRCPSGSC